MLNFHFASVQKHLLRPVRDDVFSICNHFPTEETLLSSLYHYFHGRFSKDLHFWVQPVQTYHSCEPLCHVHRIHSSVFVSYFIGTEEVSLRHLLPRRTVLCRTENQKYASSMTILSFSNLESTVTWPTFTHNKHLMRTRTPTSFSNSLVWGYLTSDSALFCG